jgi:hypothetical protein
LESGLGGDEVIKDHHAGESSNENAEELFVRESAILLQLLLHLLNDVVDGHHFAHIQQATNNRCEYQQNVSETIHPPKRTKDFAVGEKGI